MRVHVGVAILLSICALIAYPGWIIGSQPKKRATTALTALFALMLVVIPPVLSHLYTSRTHAYSGFDGSNGAMGVALIQLAIVGPFVLFGLGMLLPSGFNFLKLAYAAWTAPKIESPQRAKPPKRLVPPPPPRTKVTLSTRSKALRIAGLLMMGSSPLIWAQSTEEHDSRAARLSAIAVLATGYFAFRLAPRKLEQLPR